jgi:hypothetical protein
MRGVSFYLLSYLCLLTTVSLFTIPFNTILSWGKREKVVWARKIQRVSSVSPEKELILKESFTS